MRGCFHEFMSMIDMDWISLELDRDQWQVLVNMVMKFELHKRWEISWLAKWPLASQEGFYPVESVGRSVSESVSLGDEKCGRMQRTQNG